MTSRDDFRAPRRIFRATHNTEDLPASKKVIRQVSFGKYSLRRDPLNTYKNPPKCCGPLEEAGQSLRGEIIQGAEEDRATVCLQTSPTTMHCETGAAFQEDRE